MSAGLRVEPNAVLLESLWSSIDRWAIGMTAYRTIVASPIPNRQLVLPCTKSVYEFIVSVSPRFLAIGGEEVSPARK